MLPEDLADKRIRLNTKFIPLVLTPCRGNSADPKVSTALHLATAQHYLPCNTQVWLRNNGPNGTFK